MKYDIYSMVELLAEYEKAVVKKLDIEREMAQIRNEFNTRQISLDNFKKAINSNK